MRGLDDVVRAGKALYVGISEYASYFASFESGLGVVPVVQPCVD